MYTPQHFAVDDAGRLVEFVRRNAFGILMSGSVEEPLVTHVPFVVSQEAPLVLRTHLARANPHWEALDGAKVLTIFQGAHGMVSASWYADPERNVPTWNYAAVHCSGRARVLDTAGTREVLEQLVAQHERGWTLESADPAYIARLEGAIAGIEIAVEAIHGKFKYSQNRSDEDRSRVIAALERSGDPQDLALARAMATT